ncbi:DUF6174 domain-containing protein [Porticoccus sp. GXU_MW_L64]
MKHLLPVILALAVTGCGAVDTAQQPTPQITWQALNASNYDFDVQRSCFCTPEYTRPMRVSVRSGAVKSAVYTDDGTAVLAEVLKSVNTIDQWFAYIQKGQQRPFARLDLEFDPDKGYPTHIDVDEDERMADEEQQLTLKNLVIH